MRLAKRFCQRPALFGPAPRSRLFSSEVAVVPRDEVAARSMSGTPEAMGKRVAVISRPPKNAMQSGTANTHKWTVKFVSTGRWENPLMGWASTADPASNLNIEFATQEDAVRFCNEQGFHFMVQEPRPHVRPNQSYAGNFPYLGGPQKTDIVDDFW